MCWEALQRLSELNVAISSAVLGFLLTLSLIFARAGTPLALQSISDKSQQLIVLSFAVFIGLSGIGHLDHFMDFEKPACLFAILRTITAISGWELVGIYLYFRTKTLVALNQ